MHIYICVCALACVYTYIAMMIMMSFNTYFASQHPSGRLGPEKMPSFASSLLVGTHQLW